jgi:hypothetical protein
MSKNEVNMVKNGEDNPVTKSIALISDKSNVIFVDNLAYSKKS